MSMCPNHPKSKTVYDGLCQLCLNMRKKHPPSGKERRIQRRKDHDEKVLRDAKEARDRANAATKDKLAKAAARKAERISYINRVRIQWNAQIEAVVQQVVALRAANPGDAGINAGRNHAGNTAGGTDNPVILHLPSPPSGVGRADVLRNMTGLDNSDSGVIKFRRGTASDIFVHAI